MINRWLRRLRRRDGKGSSLYIGLLTSIMLGIVSAVLSYVIVHGSSYYIIANFYATAQKQASRREEYLAELQEFVSESGLSSEDTVRIAGWARSRPYTYLMIYKDDKLFFTSDMEPGVEDTEDDLPPEGGADGTEPEEGEDATLPEEGEGQENEGGEAPALPPTGGEETSGGATDGTEGDGSDTVGDDNGSEVGGTDTNGAVADGSGSGTDTNGAVADGSGSGSGSDSGSGSGSGSSSGSSSGDGDSWFEGITSTHDREQLMAEAQANGLHPIELSDGTLFAAVTEYSQELYYNLMNIIAFAVAAIALTVVLINYQRRVIARIKRLESDVTVVSHFDMNHRIVPEGHDEISRLSANVEIMRNSMLDNIESERRAHEANTELVTSISHDIRTPLTVLLGYLDMMKDCKADDAALQSYISASERTAMRLKELSDDMFKYSLAYGGTGSAITCEEYDAVTLVEQLLAENVLLLEENGFIVETSADDGVITDGEVVFTEAPHLMRMIDNVFSNIRKYADKERTVTLTAQRIKHSLVLTARNFIRRDVGEVESNGIGLKTCTRLAAFVAEDFGYREVGDVFEISISLRIGKAGSFKKPENDN